jgi:hypothetical protein
MDIAVEKQNKTMSRQEYTRRRNMYGREAVSRRCRGRKKCSNACRDRKLGEAEVLFDFFF